MSKQEDISVLRVVWRTVKYFLILLACIALLIWGSWVTSTLTNITEELGSLSVQLKTTSETADKALSGTEDIQGRVRLISCTVRNNYSDCIAPQ